MDTRRVVSFGSWIVALALALPLPSLGATAVVPAPAGDAFFTHGNMGNLMKPLPAPGFLDIIQATFTEDPLTGDLTFTCTVAQSFETSTPPNGNGAWFYAFNMEPEPGQVSANPLPWPENAVTLPVTFGVWALYTNGGFVAYFLDRRDPESVPVPLSVSVSGATVTIIVPASLAAPIAPQDGAYWINSTGYWANGANGSASSSVFFADSTGFVPWPH